MELVGGGSVFNGAYPVLFSFSFKARINVTCMHIYTLELSNVYFFLFSFFECDKPFDPWGRTNIWFTIQSHCWQDCNTSKQIFIRQNTYLGIPIKELRSYKHFLKNAIFSLQSSHANELLQYKMVHIYWNHYLACLLALPSILFLSNPHIFETI